MLSFLYEVECEVINGEQFIVSVQKCDRRTLTIFHSLRAMGVILSIF